MSFKAKIHNQESVQMLLKNIRDAGKRIVFTNGCFDLLHIGHVMYLEKAKELGDVLVVGLNSDDSVSRLKGKGRPIQNIESRKAILAGLQSVDIVVVFKEDTPLKLIEIVKPDVLVKGGDYSIETIVGADFVLDNGGQVRTIDFVEGYSSSAIIEKLDKSKDG